MTLRTKIILWFIALHLVFAAAAVFVLMENRLLLFGSLSRAQRGISGTTAKRVPAGGSDDPALRAG